MRKLYTAIAVLFATATAWAQTPAGISFKQAESRITDNSLGSNAQGIQYQSAANSLAKSMLKAGSTLPTADDIISEQPEGTCYSDMYRTGTMFNDGYKKAFDAYAGDIVISKDNKKVYIQNFCPVMSTGWIVGDMDENGLVTFNFPQAVLESTSISDESQTEVSYAYKIIVDDKNYKIYLDNTTQSVKFQWDGSKLTQVNADDCIGLMTAAGQFRGYGSFNNVFAKVTDNPVKPASNLKKQIYRMTYTDYTTQEQTAKDVTFAFDGNDVYLGGFYNDYWIKGTKSGNKISFPAPQYLGTETVSVKIHEYMLAFTIDAKRENADLVDNLVFDYNESTGEMSTSTMSFAVNQGYTQFGVCDIYELPSFKKANYTVGKPAKPEVYAEAYDASSGYGGVAYALSNLSEDGKELATKNIYYNVYLDGELQTFTPNKYKYITASITDVPYSFVDYQVTQSSGAVGYDFAIYQGMQQIYLYKSFSKVGVKAIYVDGSDRYESEMGEFDVTTGINNATADTEAGIKSVAYTDLSGRSVAAPAKGIYIKTVKFENGETKTVKVLK